MDETGRITSWSGPDRVRLSARSDRSQLAATIIPRNTERHARGLARFLGRAKGRILRQRIEIIACTETDAILRWSLRHPHSAGRSLAVRGVYVTSRGEGRGADAPKGGGRREARAAAAQ